MNSRFAASRQSAPSRTSSAPRPSTGVPSRVRVITAANDDTARSPFENFKDPLWALAIGMGVFFGLMAVFIAWG